MGKLVMQAHLHILGCVCSEEKKGNMNMSLTSFNLLYIATALFKRHDVNMFQMEPNSSQEHYYWAETVGPSFFSC